MCGRDFGKVVCLAGVLGYWVVVADMVAGFFGREGEQ